MASTSQGQCRICETAVAKTQMTRHLKKCLGKTDSGNDQLLVLIQDRYVPSYWVYVLMDESTTLSEVDWMLRDLWLECCGHMSAFSSKSAAYLDEPEPSLWGREERSMDDVTLAEALLGEKELRYQYDFGSTTELTVRIVGDKLPGTGDEMRIVARNDAPDIACHACGKSATELVFENWNPIPYCEDCIPPADEESMMLPIINSPRMGVCAYTGPSREP